MPSHGAEVNLLSSVYVTIRVIQGKGNINSLFDNLLTVINRKYIKQVLFLTNVYNCVC